MGGSLSGGNITPAAEFNIYVDPEAARIVFQSGIPITMVGLDVTRRTSLTDEHVRMLEAAQNPVSQAAAKIARHAIDHTREQGFTVGPNMHDSLAVAAFLDPSILKWKQYYIDVETEGELTAGETLGLQSHGGRSSTTCRHGEAGCGKLPNPRVGADTCQHENFSRSPREVRS